MATRAERWYLRSRLKTRHLLLLVVLGDEGNIHRSAEVLSITQPAASKMLRELEQMLDAQLFERLPRGVKPTAYGEALIRHARLVVDSLDQAQDDVLALKSGEVGHVAVGAITSPAVSVLPEAVAALKRQMPGLRVSVEVDSSDLLLERLAQDRLDLVVARLSAQHDKIQLRYEPLTLEPVCAVVRAGHPLLHAKALSLADLAQAAWIVPPQSTVLRHRFELMFPRANLRMPSDLVETSAMLFMTRLLERSDMLAVVSTDVARYYASHGMVGILPLELPCHMDDYGIITRTDRLLSPAAEKMAAALRAASAQALDFSPGAG